MGQACRLRTSKTDLNVIPTPFCTYTYHHSDKWADYGEDRLQWMFAHKPFLDAGIPVTGASDYIPGPFEPMMAFMSMVTRKGRDGKVWGGNQRITVWSRPSAATPGMALTRPLTSSGKGVLRQASLRISSSSARILRPSIPTH
jgi:predicted amidohydrolase YtcJ